MTAWKMDVFLRNAIVTFITMTMAGLDARSAMAADEDRIAVFVFFGNVTAFLAKDRINRILLANVALRALHDVILNF
jgi:hypothetical protein